MTARATGPVRANARRAAMRSAIGGCVENRRPMRPAVPLSGLAMRRWAVAEARCGRRDEGRAAASDLAQLL